MKIFKLILCVFLSYVGFISIVQADSYSNSNQSTSSDANNPSSAQDTSNSANTSTPSDSSNPVDPSNTSNPRGTSNTMNPSNSPTAPVSPSNSGASNSNQVGSMSGNYQNANQSSDTMITTKINSKLLITRNAPFKGVSVTTNNGIVTLTGTVKSKTQANHVTRIVRSISGVRSVDNQLIVRP